LRRKREYYAYYTSEPVQHEAQPPAPEASGPTPQSSVLEPFGPAVHGLPDATVARNALRHKREYLAMHERLAQQERRAQHPAPVIVVDDSQSSSDEESTSVSTSVGDNFL